MTQTISVLLLSDTTSIHHTVTLLSKLHFPLAITVYDLTNPESIPTLTQLFEYQVLVFSTGYTSIPNRQLWSQRIKEYIDHDGRVVFSCFCNSTYEHISLCGACTHEDYYPFTQGPQNTTSIKKLGNFDKFHPLMNQVKSFVQNASYRDTVQLTAHAHGVAFWDDGVPLVAYKYVNRVTPVVGLNFLILPKAVSNGYFDETSDGAQIIYNAIAFVVKRKHADWRNKCRAMNKFVDVKIVVE